MKIGDKVYWNDPDEGICSGIYTITDIERGKVYVLSDGKGSVSEATADELEDPIDALLKAVHVLTDHCQKLAAAALAYGEAVDAEMESGDYHLDDTNATADEIAEHNDNAHNTVCKWNELKTLADRADHLAA